MNNEDIQNELEEQEEFAQFKREIRDIYNMTEREKQESYNAAAARGLWKMACDYSGGGVV